MRTKRLLNWSGYLILAYVICGIALYYLQDRLIFHPVKLDKSYAMAIDQPFEEVNLEVNEKKNIHILQLTVPDSIRRGVILYFHGNAGNNEKFAKFTSSFTQHGYEVWLMDYPGFGKSTGSISEEILYDDAKLLYSLASSQFGRDSIIIYGYSIGTGIASYLASVRDCRQLILEAPFYDIHSVMKRVAFMYPISILSKYRFPNYLYLEMVKAPVTIFHGTKDGTIPYKNSKRLKNEIPSINLITIEGGGHNNLSTFSEYQNSLDSLLIN